ncbi:MAG: hypothetical protein JWM11_1073, partial [Planctomycetaceae bacterium]|nr:hypothetical protein [Planctomycetaceae bacterium]
MLRQRGSVSTGVVLALCLIGGLAWSLFGLQPKLPVAVETLHSSKPVLLYVFDGLAAHQKNWDATAAKKALVDSGLDAQVNKLLEFLAVESGQPAAQLSHKLLHQLISQGASISVTVSESNTQESDRAEPSGHPAFQVTLVLHGSASFAKPLNDLLLAGPLKDLNPKTETVAGRKVTRVVIPDSPGIEVGWWTEGGHLVIAGGMQGIEAALAVAQGQTANLTTNTFVQKLRASQAFDVAAVGLLDVKSLLDLARNIPIPATSPKNAPQTVGEIFKIVGIDGLGMFTGRWGFRDSALWSETTVEAKAPLTGIMASFDQSPITIAELPAIPATCEHFTLLRLDGAKIYGALLKSAKQGFEKFATPDMLPFEQWISHGNAVAGFDLKADLFDTLGDTVAFYTESGILVPSATLLVKLNDAAKFKQSLRLLQDKLKLAVNQFQDQVEFRTKESAGGRTIQIAQTKGQAFVSPSWVIDGDWLVLGTTPQAVEGYLKRVDGKLPRWKPTADLITAQKMLPEKFVSLSYSDPRGGIRSALSFAPSAIAFAEAGLVEWRKERLRAGPDANLTAEFPITPEDVPLAEEVTDPLFPNISVCTVDEKGIYWSTRNSIPGLPIPGIPGGSGGVESIAAVGVLAALLVPAVYKVREAAQRVESMNNLRRIGLALLNYGAAQRHFPAGTRPDDKIKNPEDRLSWLVDILPELEQQELQQTINEIGTHLDATNGTNLLYQLDGEPKHPDTIKRMIETIRLRIDPNGDWKIQIRPADKNQIELIIPRATPDEVEQIKSAVSASGRLEFCVLADKRNPEHRALIERAKDVQRDLVENKVVLAGWREVAPLTKKVNGKRTEVPNTDIESDSNLQFRQIKGRPDGFQEVLCVFEPKEDRRVTGKYLTRCTAERDQAG